MAWSSSRRKQTLPHGWEATRRRILERDGYRCTAIRADTESRCNDRATDVDHIIPNFEGGSEDDSNLTSCCRFHHAQKSSSEGGRANAARYRAKKPRHPGLLT